MKEYYIGVVFHFYSKKKVAVLNLTERLAIGDHIRFRSPKREERENVISEQTVDSLQIDRKPVDVAESGRMVAVSVERKVRAKDEVYKVIE